MGAPKEEYKKPTAPDSSATYLTLIQQYLAVFQFDNAVWLAERCVAEYPKSADAVYALAQCYYRSGQVRNARALLMRQVSPVTPAMAFLAAQCCYDLGDYQGGETILMKELRSAYEKSGEAGPMDEWIVQTTPCPVPNGAAGLALLGKLCRRGNRKQQAITYFRMSLQLDPFLFTSFQALSDMKVAVDARSVFGGDCAPPALPPAGGVGGGNNNNNNNMGNNNNPHRDTTPMPKSTTIKVGGASSDMSFATPLQPAARRLDMSFSPFVPSPIQHSTDFSHPSSAAITRQARQVASRQYYPPSPDTPMTSVTRSMRYLKGLGENNSNRPLFSENTSTENTATTVTSVRSEAIVEKIVEKPDKQQQENDENVNGILGLLTTFGCAYQLLSQNRCKEAIDVFHQLPLAHQRTPLVLHYVGKAHLEQGDFLSAQRSLEQMHRMDPGRMEGLELLSTVYWQLKKEIDLANLAQRTMDWDYESPQANCIAGNCFSLQKDHETALVFFRRSLQLDPYFTYTHTLSGYEYMACEDFYQAVNSFRNALSTDEGHYNAWYGLGSIYHRQEKYDLAEYHFGRAVQLHPTSSVLRCNLGMAQNANNKPFLALETLAEAFRLDPRNPQARFQRATIYSAMNRPEDALAELEFVRDAAPQEATVWFAMGKILKKLNRPEQAMRCFLTAMDLDPKDSQLIKSAMDKLDEPDIDDESTNNF